jgi:hypothetical protein
MFRWYGNAQICYVYLSDFHNGAEGWSTPFAQSAWFTRGWTLQELLAPRAVEIYAANWSAIGTKIQRCKQPSGITGIAPSALACDWCRGQDKFLAAEKFSWAAGRTASRAEDEAYCLLGLFDVNMPLLYGEGGRYAFRRLQQVVFETDSGCSLFLFDLKGYDETAPLLADSVSRFKSDLEYANLDPVSRRTGPDDFHPRLVRDGVAARLHFIDYHAVYAATTLTDDLLKSGVFAVLLLDPNHAWPGEEWNYVNCEDNVAMSSSEPGGHDDFVGILFERHHDYGFVRPATAPFVLTTHFVEQSEPIKEAILARDQQDTCSNSGQWRECVLSRFWGLSFWLSFWWNDLEGLIERSGNCRKLPLVPSSNFRRPAMSFRDSQWKSI